FCVPCIKAEKNIISDKYQKKVVVNQASGINTLGMFRIRKFYNERTCILKDKVYSQWKAIRNLICGILKPKMTNYKRKYTPKYIKDDVKLDLGVDLSYMLTWRAKEKWIRRMMLHGLDFLNSSERLLEIEKTCV
ncbi:hypothetical protein HAX54_051112, partial [Datura stramonium]|nr:hypothetical protein [Datura stramonium]